MNATLAVRIHPRTEAAMAASSRCCTLYEEVLRDLDRMLTLDIDALTEQQAHVVGEQVTRRQVQFTKLVAISN